MSRDELLKNRWNTVVTKLSDQFADGDTLDLDTIIYLIGIQELGKPHIEFNKKEKIDVMHVAVCTLLESFGYYKFTHYDKEGWPHFDVIEKLPVLKAGEQSLLMKEAIVDYFLKNAYIK